VWTDHIHLIRAVMADTQARRLSGKKALEHFFGVASRYFTFATVQEETP